MSRPEIRPALITDRASVLEAMYLEPSPEMVGSCGGVEPARRFGRSLLDASGFPNGSATTVVASLDGEVVGMLQYTVGGQGTHSTVESIRISVSAFGWRGALARIPAGLARTRLETEPLVGEFYISEVHVHPHTRGSGIGTALLDWAIDHAASKDVTTMWLTTGSANPARHLYARCGFITTAERQNASYERRTGNPGRVRLERPIP